jgi:N-acetylated-alpha-linked acidic dipeptidase
VGGSHSLEVFATETAGTVSQPGQSVSLVNYALHHPAPNTNDQATPPAASKPFTIGALGAGSDYQGFLDFVGVASLNNGFEGQTKSGIYHSVYDSIYWYTHFSDANQADGRALSQYTAAALLRLGDSSVLPFEFQHLASTISGYLDEIQKEADGSSHRMDFATLHKQLETLRQSGEKYEALLEATELKPAIDSSQAHDLNDLLIRSERAPTRPEGLPNRTWYKHQIYAPGFYTGYGVKTLPGIREAVEAKNWQLAQHEAGVVEECLSDLNRLLDQAVDKLAGM